MRILAIETSCDETAVAVVEKAKGGLVRVLGEVVASSEEMHVKTGGVVPEVASREQLKSIIPVLSEVMSQATGISNSKIQISKQHHRTNDQIIKWARENVDVVAVTMGPGLIGSLLVGVETGKSLALAWNKPLIPVNHLVAHLYANWVEDKSKIKSQKSKTQIKTQKAPAFPAVGLVVSGGHTELVLMEDHGKIKLLGSTRDDAAGECFDKCSRLLGLGYPGGPAIAAEAAKFEVRSSKFEIKLPRPLLNEDTYDFSFSGLKVAVTRELRSNEEKGVGNKLVAMLASELQEAVVDCLVGKVVKAVEEYRPKSVLLAGGVAANSRLRQELELRIKNKELGKTKLYVPLVKYCTDNAVMVGAAAIYNYSPTPIKKVKADPGLEIIAK